MGLKFRAFTGFLIVCSLALAVQIFFFSPIDSPEPLLLPAAALLTPTSNHLQSVIKLGQGFLKDPEDIVVNQQGALYTATRDGWIKRLHKNGSWESWKMLGGHGLIGLTTTTTCDDDDDGDQGAILVCDVQKGLLKVCEDGVTIVASHVNGSKIRFADDVIEASDGNAYFSVASTKYDFHNWYLDVLEAKPHGQLLKYDPSSQETTILLHDLGFANGVALSRDQDFLVVCETWRFRCLKYWLKGDEKGKTKIFIENLPGVPDNIKLAPDGSFWIALPKVSCKGMEFVHASEASKYVMATFPKLFELVSCLHKQATAINVDADGNIIRRFDDPNGKVVSFVTSALEYENHLYLGSLNANFIGKLPLREA